MHHDILSPVEGMLTDHVNRVRTDNRRVNLRHATYEQNRHNQGVRDSSLTGYKGVYVTEYRYGPRRKVRYRACINVDGKTKYLGNYYTAEQAARVYDQAAREHHGEFACLNFPDEVVNEASTEQGAQTE